jgi:hypothetical protein
MQCNKLKVIKMNKSLTILCSLAMATGFWTQTGQAQDAAGPVPLEAFYCNMQEGKSMKDLAPVLASFSSWADKNDPGYTAWLLTRQFGLASELPDVIWLGSNPSAEKFGKGMDAWRAGGGEVQAAFNKVVDCSLGHVLASSIEIAAPDGPPGDGVVMFTECELDDDGSLSGAAKVHQGIAGELRKMGAKNSNWMLVPMLGGGDLEYDYLGVATFPSWGDFFAAYEMYVNGGVMQKAMKAMDDIADCRDRTPTVWDVKLVRAGAR